MPDPKTCLGLPFGPGHFEGALYQPLLPFKLSYRYGPLHKTLPWIRIPYPEPMTHGEAAAFIRSRCGCECKREWLEKWEETAMAWRVPDEPVAWPYIRVSHDHSAASGLSFEVQLARILEFWRFQLPKGKYLLGPTFSDPDVSAKKTRFPARRGGYDLMNHTRPNDAILFYKIDRSARQVVDAATLLADVWRPQNITPYFVMENLDLNTSAGVAMFHTGATFAEYFSSDLSQSCKDRAAALKATGRPTTGRKLGFIVRRRGGRAYFAPDHAEWIRMARIEHLRDVEGMSWTEIARQVELELCKATGKKFVEEVWWSGKNWKVQNRYRAWKEILAEGHAKRPAEYEAARVEAEKNGTLRKVNGNQ